MTLRALAERADADARGDGARFVDVRYTDLVAEPLAVVEQLYAAAGLPLQPAARTAMLDWLAAHPQHQAGRHTYDLGEYGLDRATVEAALADYLDRFQPGTEDT